MLPHHVVIIFSRGYCGDALEGEVHRNYLLKNFRLSIGVADALSILCLIAAHALGTVSSSPLCPGGLRTSCFRAEPGQDASWVHGVKSTSSSLKASTAQPATRLSQFQAPLPRLTPTATLPSPVLSF